MGISRCVPNAMEYRALAALADDHMDYFVSRAVRLDSSDGTSRLLLLTEFLKPIGVHEAVIEDEVVDDFFPVYDAADPTHKVVEVVGVYLDSDDQAFFGKDMAILGVRRLSSRVSAATVLDFLG